MLFISDCGTKFITTDAYGAPCFSRGLHHKLAKERGVDLTKMDNETFRFSKLGSGISISNFLNS